MLNKKGKKIKKRRTTLLGSTQEKRIKEEKGRAAHVLRSSEGKREKKKGRKKRKGPRQLWRCVKEKRGCKKKRTEHARSKALARFQG